MIVTTAADGREQEVTDLFAATFAASEGAEEGELIGGLARDLLAETAPDDIRVYLAEDGNALKAGVIFTRLTYADDPRKVFILSPMAVATDHQGQGIGQRLIAHALSDLRAAGVDVAVTYGNPAFYGKVGFKPLDPDTAAAPLPLSYPHGWIGQSLAGPDLAPLQGQCACVSALNNPVYW